MCMTYEIQVTKIDILSESKPVLAECACASVCHIPFHAVNMNGCNAVVRCFARVSVCACECE